MFDMHGETVCYNEKDETAVIIDQTLLPGEIVTLELWEKEEMYDAIKRLAVRGAPAIGVFAAIFPSVSLTNSQSLTSLFPHEWSGLNGRMVTSKCTCGFPSPLS